MTPAISRLLLQYIFKLCVLQLIQIALFPHFLYRILLPLFISHESETRS